MLVFFTSSVKSKNGMKQTSSLELRAKSAAEAFYAHSHACTDKCTYFCFKAFFHRTHGKRVVKYFERLKFKAKQDRTGASSSKQSVKKR